MAWNSHCPMLNFSRGFKERYGCNNPFHVRKPDRKSGVLLFIPSINTPSCPGTLRIASGIYRRIGSGYNCDAGCTRKTLPQILPHHYLSYLRHAVQRYVRRKTCLIRIMNRLFFRFSRRQLKRFIALRWERCVRVYGYYQDTTGRQGGI